jgi:glyoxylase-like metal-dependent hydrolase (beta-lactamase superfamily II)
MRMRFSLAVALVDTGAGDKLGPTLGKLLTNLAVAGIAPHQVDTVLLTHMHPDHSNGLTDAGACPSRRRNGALAG